MKKPFLIILSFVVFLNLQAQESNKLNDIGRIVLNTYISNEVKIPAEAKTFLENKLNQIASNYGVGGNGINPRFIITATINVGTKDIIAGPPQMISLNIQISFFIGDASDNKIFANTTMDLKGVGTNENKALIEAIKNINPKSKNIATFIEEGKNKIVSYYTSQCDFILKNANTLSDQFKYEQAIYELMAVPETCKDCYFKCKDEASVIFKKKVERDCIEKQKEAKLVWAAEPTENGALKASAILQTIIPSDNCRAEIIKLSDEIKTKLQTDQQKKYDFDMLEMQKKYDTEQKRLDAEKEISIEYYKNQPKTISYNNIYWR